MHRGSAGAGRALGDRRRGAGGGCGVRGAQESPVGERCVESLRELVARLGNECSDRCVEIGDERDHVDNRLGGETWDGGRAEVMDLRSHEQRREALALGLESGGSGGVVGDDLDGSVTATGPRQVFGRGATCCQPPRGSRLDEDARPRRRDPQVLVTAIRCLTSPPRHAPSAVRAARSHRASARGRERTSGSSGWHSVDRDVR